MLMEDTIQSTCKVFANVNSACNSGKLLMTASIHTHGINSTASQKSDVMDGQFSMKLFFIVVHWLMGRCKDGFPFSMSVI